MIVLYVAPISRSLLIDATLSKMTARASAVIITRAAIILRAAMLVSQPANNETSKGCFLRRM